MYVHRALAYQAIHPCKVGKLVPTISRGNNVMAVTGVQLVAALIGKTVIMVTRIEPIALSAHHR